MPSCVCVCVCLLDGGVVQKEAGLIIMKMAGRVDPLALRMFDKIMASDKVIKSQQRGDAELTGKEKLEILSELLVNFPGNFLQRFGSLFDYEDLQYFAGSTDYEVQYRTRELNRLLTGNNMKKRTANRRYRAIEELTVNSDYFTDREMRERCPLLYEQYIGQFLTEEQRDKITGYFQPGELSLAGHIANKLDQDVTAEKLIKQVKIEEHLKGGGATDSNTVLTVSEDTGEAEEDKLMLRKEFLRLMHLRFINGEDEYDYRTVDENEEYDVSDIKERDDEEHYFDSEEPASSLANKEPMDF